MVEPASEANLEDERKLVDRLRLGAESQDTEAKPEDFVIIDGKYRVVRPYHYDFICSVKNRQHNQKLVDIFATEFPARTREYYHHAALIGLLRVEGRPGAGPDTPLPSGTRMRHLVHRHEPPVSSTPVDVIAVNAAYVAVNKPPTMPVHVAGQYRKNTVLGVLGAERPDLGPLHAVHRLDKPVSGVLIFARSPEAADALRIGIADKGSVDKIYVARVAGRFPATMAEAAKRANGWGGGGRGSGGGGGDASVQLPGDLIVADCPLAWDRDTNHVLAMPETREECWLQDEAAAAAAAAAQRPVVEAAAAAEAGNGDDGSKRQPKKRRKKNPVPKEERIAAAQAAQAAKVSSGPIPRTAVTHFRLLGVASDGLTSLVECRPQTGRTHQIRVHLAYLGHPIANDGQYGGHYNGPTSCREMAERLGVAWHTGDGQEGVVGRDDLGAGIAAADLAAHEGLCPLLKAPEELFDPHCPHCPLYGPKNYPADLRPLWLHARRYASPDWAFEAPLPDWASQDWVPLPPKDTDIVKETQ